MRLVLRDHRRRLGLTQRELARRAGLSVEHVGGLERGARGASWPTIRKLAAALGVEPHALIDWSTVDAAAWEAARRGRQRRGPDG